MKRRNFVWLAVLAVTVGSLRKLFGASSDEIEISSEGYRVPHHHQLRITTEMILNPPESEVVLTTSPAPFYLFFHTHTVALSPSQLKNIRSGETVRVVDSSGVHSFTIKWNRPQASG